MDIKENQCKKRRSKWPPWTYHLYDMLEISVVQDLITLQEHVFDMQFRKSADRTDISSVCKIIVRYFGNSYNKKATPAFKKNFF